MCFDLVENEVQSFLVAVQEHLDRLAPKAPAAAPAPAAPAPVAGDAMETDAPAPPAPAPPAAEPAEGALRASCSKAMVATVILHVGVCVLGQEVGSMMLCLMRAQTVHL